MEEFHRTRPVVPLSEMPRTAPRPRRVSVEGAAALAILLGYIVFVASLPCFPSADGPVHLYYVHVLRALLGGHSPVYARYFEIRHYVPPYSLYYYSLLALSTSMPLLMADKVVICVYLLVFVLGFRYLAGVIGPAADRATLLATPLLLNWPLGMGFVNFCLSLGLALWAAGLWLRTLGTRSTGRRVAFLVLVTCIMLTHPVPLLLLLGVCGALLLVRWARAGAGAGVGAGRGAPAHGVADLLTLGLAALNLGYVALFTNHNPLQQDSHPVPTAYWHETLGRFAIYGREHALAFLLGRGPDVLLYRAGLLAVLLVPMGLAGSQRWQNRRLGLWTAGDTFLVLGVLLLVALPLVPSQLNGLYYFADRLVLCVWMAFLLAAAGWRPGSERSLRWQRAEAWLIVGALALVNGGLLHGANRVLRPVAVQVASLDRTSLRPAGQLGIYLEDARPLVDAPRDGVSWNPYYWALLHIFRHNDEVLANAPWAGESILPVAPTGALPERTLPALAEPLPTHVEETLEQSPADWRKALAASTFVAENEVYRPATTELPRLLQAPWAAGWRCRWEVWYRLCSRPPVVWQADAEKP